MKPRNLNVMHAAEKPGGLFEISGSIDAKGHLGYSFSQEWRLPLSWAKTEDSLDEVAEVQQAIMDLCVSLPVVTAIASFDREPQIGSNRQGPGSAFGGEHFNFQANCRLSHDGDFEPANRNPTYAGRISPADTDAIADLTEMCSGYRGGYLFSAEPLALELSLAPLQRAQVSGIVQALLTKWNLFFYANWEGDCVLQTLDRTTFEMLRSRSSVGKV